MIKFTVLSILVAFMCFHTPDGFAQKDTTIEGNISQYSDGLSDVSIPDLSVVTYYIVEGELGALACYREGGQRVCQSVESDEIPDADSFFLDPHLDIKPMTEFHFSNEPVDGPESGLMLNTLGNGTTTALPSAPLCYGMSMGKEIKIPLPDDIKQDKNFWLTPDKVLKLQKAIQEEVDKYIKEISKTLSKSFEDAEAEGIRKCEKSNKNWVTKRRELKVTGGIPYPIKRSGGKGECPNAGRLVKVDLDLSDVFSFRSRTYDLFIKNSADKEQYKNRGDLEYLEKLCKEFETYDCLATSQDAIRNLVEEKCFDSGDIGICLPDDVNVNLETKCTPVPKIRGIKTVCIAKGSVTCQNRPQINLYPPATITVKIHISGTLCGECSGLKPNCGKNGPIYPADNYCDVPGNFCYVPRDPRRPHRVGGMCTKDCICDINI